MSEFGSIKNATKPDSAANINNESLAQFGVASPNDAPAAPSYDGKTQQPKPDSATNNQPAQMSSTDNNGLLQAMPMNTNKKPV